MDIKKFGSLISKLRKELDLTQSMLADHLNVTRQAVSRWELGDSFPDISLLPKLSDVLGISIDQLLNQGVPLRDEYKIVFNVIDGTPEHPIARGFEKHGIDIGPIVDLAEYMNESGLTGLLKKAPFEKLNEEMLERFVPFLDQEAKDNLLYKIIDGEIDGSLLKIILPYLDPSKYNLIEAAILEGYVDGKIMKSL